MGDHDPAKAVQELLDADPHFNPKLTRAQAERLLSGMSH